MRALWSGEALGQALRARSVGAMPTAVGGISIDTRSLKPGDLFFAIKGDARDGHDFVAGAFAGGAGAAVVDEAHAGQLESAGPLFVVDDVLAALQRLGQAARARSAARIVAVTGSVGKTGTKEALRHVLSRHGETHASVASYNNHWGVPLTLARMPQDSDFGVFEIGMNHAFEILPLTAQVRPHIALITTVAPVHLAHFRGLEGIADAKGEIFSGLLPGGTAILNRDNPYYERMLAHARASQAGSVVTFGEHEAADIRLLRAQVEAEYSVVSATVFGEKIAYKLGSPGRHSVLNSLAVIATVRKLGLDLAMSLLSLADLTPPSGRGARSERRVKDGRFTLIDESYNANPASMRAALELLSQATIGLRGRRIAVLGDMLELGEAGAQMHAALAEAIEQNRIDLVFASGPLMKNLWQALPFDRRGAYAETSTGLEDPLCAALRPGDAVVVKGSLGSRMGPLVGALTSRFPAAEPAAEGSV